MTFTLAAMIGTSTAGAAQTVGHSMLAISSFTVPNTADPIVVPQGDRVIDAATLATATISPDTDFASLDEAVAAHGEGAETAAVRCLAGAIYYEAKGEPLAGQLAVAEVILNRAKSGRFADDVCSVVTQRGQFGFVRGGQIPTIDEGRAAYQKALAVARVAIADAWDSPAADALYFNRPGARPAARIVKVAALGKHVFYR